MNRQKLNILNRKARYEYFLDKTFIAGIQLTGSEIKSIRLSNVNINDSFCYILNNELFIKNIYIAEYKQASYMQQHEPNRDRKLLLNKVEILKIKKKLETKGFTIIPTKLFLNDKGLVKLEIALGKGKKLYDKKNTIKERDIDRETSKNIKNEK